MAAKKKASAKKTSTAKKSGAKKSSAKKGPSKKAAQKGGKARGRQQSAKKQARKISSAATMDFSGKNVAEFRKALRTNLIRPLELVMLSRDRIEEALDDAVERGRMTRKDAQELATSLYSRGRKQTDDLLKDLEQLMGRGRSGLESRTTSTRDRSVDAASAARRSVDKAADTARKAADPLLAQADRARRAVGVGPSFPITGYDNLTATQVAGRLETLTPAELRKVRDYEKRRANRKTVVDAIEERLS